MVRVLCVGDIHVGRPIAGVPEGATYSDLTTVGAWKSIVGMAERERPDLLAISGDLVDERNKYFESIGPIEEGLQTLARLEIPVVAVAGNHDWDVLPSIARNNPNAITYLGANQRWERVTIPRNGRPLIHVDGWSFGARHVDIDPLDSYRNEHPGTAPVLGLVHVDLDASEQRYAPSSLWKLHAKSVDAWLIGHIHVSRLITSNSGPVVLYPGSPYGLDAAESGDHGLWMLDIEAGMTPVFSRCSSAPVRFESLSVDVSHTKYEDDARAYIEQAVQEFLEQTIGSTRNSNLKLLQIRLVISGSFPPKSSLTETVAGLLQREWSSGGAMALVNRVEDRTTVSIDIEQAATQPGMFGSLARLIRDGDPGVLQAMHDEISQLRKSKEFSGFGDDLAKSDESLAETMRAEAWGLLRALDVTRVGGQS